MGEMADFYNEQCWDEEEARIDYRMGRMLDVEAYDRGIIDERGYELGPHAQPLTKTCRCCGASRLTWGQHGGKWRLFENEALHKCPSNPLKEPL